MSELVTPPLVPQFLKEHLRLEDVRLYTLDLMVEYSALQRFTPFRSEGARCMNWARMLAEFGFPLKSPNYVRLSRTGKPCTQHRCRAARQSVACWVSDLHF